MLVDDINKLGDAQKVKETDTLNEQLLKLQKMFEEVSLFYVKKVAEQINVIKEMNPTSINRMNIMTAVNEDISLIKQVLKNTIKQSIGPLKDVLQTALQEDWETENFKRLLDKHPLGEPQKKQLNRMTEMIARQTYGAMETLSNTTAIDRQYRKLVDRAVLGVTSGMGSYTETVRDGIKELGHAGMQVEYASGYHRRLDSAIMQNITNAAKQISQQGADLCREQMGTDAVELSAHVSPAPDHEPVQGRVFLNAEFAKMQTQQDFVDITGKHYKGFRRPIGEWNCMHIANPFDTQDSIRTWTDKDLQDMINANAKGFIWNGKHYTMYQGRQLMRRIETQIRREKDTAIAARTVGDSVLEKQCKDRISALEKRYADLCKTAELPPQWDRTVVDQYRSRTNSSGNQPQKMSTPPVGTEEVTKAPWPQTGTPISSEKQDQLYEAARKQNVELEGLDGFDGDPGLIKRMIEGISKVSKEFPLIKETGIKLKFRFPENEDEIKNDFMEWKKNDKTILINNYAFRDAEILRTEYAKKEKEGFFVKGTTSDSIILHEMGHVAAEIYKISPYRTLKHVLGTPNKDRIRKICSGEISHYAGKNPQEALAESFSAHYSGKDTELSLKIFEEFIKVIGERGKR